MKSVNAIRITKIATVLQTLPGNNVVGGEPGIALVRAEQMHNFGKELMEILADEIDFKSGEKNICQNKEEPKK